MVINEINFRSSVLRYRQKLIVMLPQTAECNIRPGKLKCLTLLHGLSDDETSWMRWSNVERYADKYGIAVVLPSVEKSFYTNMAYGDNFFDYVSEEIPQFIQSFLPISDKREDNFIAGLSMGGYGAYKIALTNPEKYCAAASLSGVVDINGLLASREAQQDVSVFNDIKLVFGDLDKVPGSKHDLLALIDKNKNNPLLPKLYQWCGTEDYLHQNNLIFRNHISPLGLDHIYEEGPGDHSWPHWDRMIQRVLQWLDLDEVN
jgi:putative tributyrin esterase